MNRFLKWIIPAIFVYSLHTLAAEDTNAVIYSTSPPGYHATEEPLYELPGFSKIDELHRHWSSNVVNAAEYFDHFFADNRIDEIGNDTRIKLSLGLKLSEHDDPTYIHRLNVRLRLPKLSKRILLVFEGDDEYDNSQSSSEILRESSQSKPDAALRYSLGKRSKVKADTDVGVRFGSPSQAFLRLRLSRDYDLSETWQVRLLNKLAWYTSDGWVDLAEFQINKLTDSAWLYRSSSEVEWREDRDYIRPAQTFSVFKTFSRDRALRFEIGGNWPETPHTFDARYYASVTHRRLLHKNWLYFEVKPGIEFLQEFDYETMYFLKFQFDILIGKIK